MDGNAEAGGVGGAGLAAVSEFLGENEEFLTGAAGLFHPYKSAHGRARWKDGIRRTHTLNQFSSDFQTQLPPGGVAYHL